VFILYRKAFVSKILPCLSDLGGSRLILKMYNQGTFSEFFFERKKGGGLFQPYNDFPLPFVFHREKKTPSLKGSFFQSTAPLISRTT